MFLAALFCNGSKREAIQMSINMWVDQQIVVYPIDGMLLTDKKECIHETWINMKGLKRIMLNERNHTKSVPCTLSSM